MTIADAKVGSAVQTSGSEKIQKEKTVRVLRAGNEDIVVGENSYLEGSFETQGSMFIDGRLSNANLRANLISIGATGHVGGDVNVVRAEIAGNFDGSLHCEGEIILRSTSSVSGEITCGKLITHRGAVIKAHVSVNTDENLPPVLQSEALNSIVGKPLAFIARTTTRRMTSFAYGVVTTLGLIGLLSLIHV